MVNEYLNVNNQYDEDENGFDFKAVLMKLFIYWKWVVASVVICLGLAFLYLKTQPPLYKIQATIMINDEQKGSFNNQMMTLQQDFGIMSTTGGIDNEIEVLRSKSVIKQAVIDLGLYVRYSLDNGFLRPDQVLYGAYPIEVYIAPEDLERLNTGMSFVITQLDSTTNVLEYAYVDEDTHLVVEVKKNVTSYPFVLNTPIGRLAFDKGDAAPMKPGQELHVSIMPPIKVARSCLGALTVEPTSKTTSVAYVSYLDVNKKRGVDFVNSLISVYNRENNNDKNLVAAKTEEFIKKRLEIVSKELDDAEEQMAQYKRSSELTNLTGDAQKVLEGSSEYEKKRVDVVTQLRLVTYLRDYVNDPKNEMQAIPANVGLVDAALTAMVGKYNEVIVERNRLLRTASESNPAVLDLTTKARLLVETIKTSIESLHQSLTIKQEDLVSQTKKFNAKLEDTPTQEKILAGYKRQLEVKSGLYLMLLQKREENSIALAATADNAKIIDAALANDFPVSPKRKMIWMVALVAGCAIPVVLIYLLELLRYRIEGRNDVEKLTKVPILGDVALSRDAKSESHSIVVRENSNDLMAETFRSIRTNLQFVLDGPEKKVIQFTSSSSGEGKTFISSNLATSMALIGKKVLLVGLDVRKPRLAEMFNLSDYKKGITSFLAGNANDKDLLLSQVMPSGVNKNLDILPAGIIPPNPAELLSRVNLDKAIEFLKEEYDYVILDTAPVGLVADTLIISRVTDATVFICRADYTPKSDLELVNSLYNDGKLKNMSIVVNGVDMTKRKYGYYYGYGKSGSGSYGKYGYGKYGNNA